MANSPSNPAFSAPRALVIAIILLVPALMALVVMHAAGPFSWDDGAITLAFGKTLFQHGRFALNAASPVVEGTSSLLYTVLTGFMQWLGNLGFEATITAARTLSALFASASAVLLAYAMAPSLGRDRALVFALLFALLPLNYVEIFNGMEMLALGFLFLTWCVLLRAGRYGAALTLLPLLLLCRFETSFFIGFALCAAWVFCGNSLLRRHFLIQFLVLCGAFLVISAWRYTTFGEFFPNTILAKMHTPYSFTGLREVQRKLAGLEEFLLFYGLPLFFALLAVWRSPALRGRIEPWLLLAFGVFAGLSGKNWGYDGRMALGALPFTMMFLADAYGQNSVLYRPARAALLVGATLIMQLVAGYTSVNHAIQWHKVGFKFEGFRRENRGYSLQSEPFNHDWYSVTPENYRITGNAVTRLADALDLPIIRFAVPDVGGLGLCCDRVEVIDTALLANPELARKGYDYFETQLAELRPDVIETHNIWSGTSKIYELAVFKENYAPIFFEYNLFHLRRDHLARFQSEGFVREIDPATLNFDQIRYANAEIEKEYLNAQPVIYGITLPAAQ